MSDFSLPPLPHGDDLFSAAVRSVHKRKFYDEPLPVTKDRALMGQMLRLVEELGEYETATGVAAENELADVAIVLAQVAWLCGLDPAAMNDAKVNHNADGLVEAVGSICRAMRRQPWNPVPLRLAILRATATVWAEAARIGASMDVAIAGKLSADERRGYRHNGGGAIAEVPAYRLAGVHDGYYPDDDEA